MRTAFILTSWLWSLISDLTVWTKHKEPVSVTVIIAFHLLGAKFLPNIQVKFMHNPNHINEQLATGWTVRVSNPGEARFPAVQKGPGNHPASFTCVPGLSRVEGGRGVTLTPHPF